MALSDAPPRRPVTSTSVLTVEPSGARTVPDRLVTEEPLEVRLAGTSSPPVSLAVTMRTPGHDFELAVGLCLTEGLVGGRADVHSVAYCLEGDGAQQYNVVTVRTRGVAPAVAPRNLVATASCGICGKAALDDVEVRCPPVAGGPVVAASVLRALPERLAGAQRVFDRTGGLHAAARFRRDGELVVVREDVGRHNALDKLVGHAFLSGDLPLSDDVVLLSGRVGFELVQKAAIAGVPLLAAISAPSSLAVAAAERLGQTVVGFLRGDRFNVYSHPERVDAAA